MLLNTASSCFKRALLTSVGLVLGLSILLGTAYGQVEQPRLPTIRVLIVGASTAHGWRDKQGGGYLERTFAELANRYGVNYKVYNKAIPGAKISDVKTRYVAWLNTYHPDVVVLSWGMLNDLRGHTPLFSFMSSFVAEVNEAVDRNSTVYVVTPPPSKASYGAYGKRQQAFAEAQIDYVKTLHNPCVTAFDLLTQMKAYLRIHHDNVALYMADNAHPNTRGHELAAQLLASDFTSNN